jgi:integrase/recombinase XerD
MTTARHPVAAHAARTDPGDLIPAPSATGGRRVTLARAAALAANSRRSPKTRDDYAAIYRRFIAWLTDRLGGDPYLEDLTLEVLLAWRDHRETSGGRRGQGLAPASLQVEVAALRVLARHVGLHELAIRGLTAAPHHPTPPETLTPAECDTLLRMPDRRTRIGLRDHAVLQVLVDTGLRSAELRGLTVGDLIRVRVDSPHRSLRVVRAKGGRGRVIPLTAAADRALDSWLTRHPAARPLAGGRRLPTADAPLLCTLGRLGRDPGRPLSANALNALVGHHAKAARLPEHLRHPHVLRHYWATRHADLGTPLHRLQELGGWQSLRTLQAYLHVTEDDLLADVDRLAAADAARTRERRPR